MFNFLKKIKSNKIPLAQGSKEDFRIKLLKESIDAFGEYKKKEQEINNKIEEAMPNENKAM